MRLVTGGIRMVIEFSTLVVEGEEATSFLQGQLTADIQHLDFIEQSEISKPMGLAGLCNIKGRLLAVFWVIDCGHHRFHLLLPKSISERIKQTLQRYILRSKVSLSLQECTPEDLDALPSTLIVPWIVEETVEKYVPQMVSLDVLKGVHPKKGCYIGQEIVTRMRDLGKNKKRLVLIERSNHHPLEINANIMNDKQENVGEVILSDKNKSLAVVNLNALNSPLWAEGSIAILNVWKRDDE